MTESLKNDFDIVTYLLGYGFGAMESHLLFNDPSTGRKVKVKLIEPNSAYKCGFQTMAISSVNRRFKKIECPVPQDRERADLVFIPILFGSVKTDRNLNNVIQIQGRIACTGFSDGYQYFILVTDSYKSVSVIFDSHYGLQIRVGYRVHCIAKINHEFGLYNSLTLIGLTKLS